MEIFYNSTLVVTISLVLFIALLAYLGVHKFLAKALDDRAEKIRGELAEAKQLREEAQEVYAEFERKQKEVQGQADEIVAHAKAEAEAAAVKAKDDIAASIERRLKAADEQISLAESDAIRQVKDKAVAVAIAAASEVLTSKVGGEQDAAMVEAAIKDVGSRLH